MKFLQLEFSQPYFVVTERQFHLLNHKLIFGVGTLFVFICPKFCRLIMSQSNDKILLRSTSKGFLFERVQNMVRGENDVKPSLFHRECNKKGSTIRRQTVSTKCPCIKIVVGHGLLCRR